MFEHIILKHKLRAYSTRSIVVIEEVKYTEPLNRLHGFVLRAAKRLDILKPETRCLNRAVVKGFKLGYVYSCRYVIRNLTALKITGYLPSWKLYLWWISKFQPPTSDILMSCPLNLVVCTFQMISLQSVYWYPTFTSAVVTPYTLCLYTLRRFHGYVNLITGSASKVFLKRIPSIVILRWIRANVDGIFSGVSCSWMVER